MAGNADIIKIPVQLALDQQAESALKAALGRLRSNMETEFKAFAQRNPGQPFKDVRMTGKETFTTGGRRFEIGGQFSSTEDPQTQAAIDKFIANVREIPTSAAKFISVEAERLKTFKRSMKFQPLETQRDAIQNFLQSYGDINNELSMRLDKINETMKRQASAMKREQTNTEKGKFRSMLSGLRTRPLEEQLSGIERYIADQTNPYLDEAKIFRGKIEQAIRVDTAKAKKMQSDRFKMTTMATASAGIGLLGQAGFPLLNIAFASMSGDVLGAGIAAASTAIGETFRALDRVIQERVKAAQSLHFVPTGLRVGEARFQAHEAFLSIGQQTVQANTLKMLEEYNKARGNTTPITNRFQATKGAAELAWNRMFNSDSAVPGTSAPLFSQFISDYNRLRPSKEEELTNARSARDFMRLNMQGNLPSMANDPYAMYMRMQNSMMTNPLQQEIVKIQQEVLRKMDEDIESRERGIKAQDRNTQALGGPSHGASGEW